MRRTLRLLANVKPAARYLEAGAQTGLTGILTHNSPRSSLLFLYSRTLERLQKFPESSVYRQSAEALTKHRQAIVEAARPPGYAEWQARARQVLEAHPEAFTAAAAAERNVGPSAVAVAVAVAASAGGGGGGGVYVRRHDPRKLDSRVQEWDGESDEGPGFEGLRGQEERDEAYADTFERKPIQALSKFEWEPEPQLTADQIEEIEDKVGAGLIEEVILMAESELKLIDILYEAKVWEPLEEKPAEGQWTYFERNSQ